jgi:lipid-A-disaccharide synthase
MKSFFLFAGEVSGDLHGRSLMQALQNCGESCRFFGVGGPRMRQEKLECYLKMEEFQVMGFTDIVKTLPRLWKLFYQVRNQILKIQPDCVILIDYPGFNLRLAKALRTKNFKGKLVQYICPTIWAHGKNRIETLCANYDLLLSVYPFEADYFTRTPLRVEYIGNPLTEIIQNHVYDPYWNTQIELPMDKDVIALFPGSRKGEIQKHVPQQLEAAVQLKQHYDVRFALSCAQEELKIDLLKYINSSSLKLNNDIFIVPSQYRYELMKYCKVALAKSGTVTLELALHGVPTVTHYELSLLNYLFAKFILQLQLPHYCIVNILQKQTIFPEFMGYHLPSTHLTKELEAFYSNASKRQQLFEACQSLKQQIGHRCPHHNAATAILELMG